MTTVTEFLAAHPDGLATDDALASFLPLLRQVANAHSTGMVAPLQGLNQIQVESNRLWFEESLVAKPALEPAKLREKEEPGTLAVEVLGVLRIDVRVEQGDETVTSLQVGKRGEPFAQPVYFPGYLAWEHELGHHDPLTDVFVLGLILASLTCGLDLNDPDDLAAFVQHRRNLFDLNPKLHPVLAKAIARMTELNRHRRPQDTAALLRTLENYRDQDVDFEFDLARLPEFKRADRTGRRAMILSVLQQRLFEISRRNRLLHFRPTNATVNLTWASVPLSFDVRNIRPEQLLTWGHDFKAAVAKGDAVSLNRFLRFEEALYLPGQLDHIRTEARRDQTEYGFAQLRLVICFLRWANLKENPPEQYDSPLVLLPVKLTKTKGVRDVFLLEPTDTRAEINPVLRFHFKQLYNIELPDFIDLTENSLDELHGFLAAKVQSNEAAVMIEKIDKPRINLIHAKAQRRLEQYRRRVRLSGRGVRTFLDLDYSYDKNNYHPLGLRLFQTRIAPREPRLRTLIGEAPRPRLHMSPVVEEPQDNERLLYSQVEEERNPYRWEFDLCNVTLGNFHYRKLSLVRDYDTLLDQGSEQPAFDAVFSLEPREVGSENQQALPMSDSFPIVKADPTQASAVALARSGKHFIIQGPPGTGKSQTITNLIADFAVRGKRVLFVCEKRAAIDVVFHRLQQAGLAELCCLIHDAQDDKKAFIADLKETYEAFTKTKPDRAEKAEKQRNGIIDSIAAELAPLGHYQMTMCSAAPQAGLPLFELLQRAVVLSTQRPALSAMEVEQLPAYHHWHANHDCVNRFDGLLTAVQENGVLAHHPLHGLHSRFGTLERPLATIRELLPRIAIVLDRFLKELPALDVPPEDVDTLDELRQLTDYASQLVFLAEHDNLSVLVSKSEGAKKLAAQRRKFTTKEQELASARLASAGWREKLSPEDTKAALEQARAQQHSFFRFFSPGWWRLRGLVTRNYDFTRHQVKPTFSQVLETLQTEHQRVAELSALETETRGEFGFEGPFKEYSERISALAGGAEKLPAFLQSFHRRVLESSRGNEAVVALAKLKDPLTALTADLDALLADAHDRTLEQLRTEVASIENSLDLLPSFVSCLKALGELPAPLANAWRRFPFAARQLEAAIAARTIEELLRADPSFAKYDAAAHTRLIERIEPFHEKWHTACASSVRERVCAAFLENVRISSSPAAQLTAEQKEKKARYARGRRELEHEFAKTMRYRSIRDLVDDETGEVLRDLKPIWLMSPLSVSDALPLAQEFDVVIFDEASQVTLEESVPTIARAKQVLVVGDEMQLPPTSFFAARSSDEDERVLVEDAGGRQVEYDLSSNSLLNHSARNLPATMLGWHYRSRSESLISFSNAAFYSGRLLTVPEVALPPAAMTEIVVKEANDGTANVLRLLERPVSFHFLERGLYDQRRNAAEADYIARLVRGLMNEKQSLSIGVIAFSEAQQGEIESALNRLAEEDSDFADQLEAEWERETDGQFVGLLVKNLENIQGDERDVVILSVCYCPNAGGKMLMNFGPINQSGGERRLNVAFSRAKRHMVVVSSIHHTSITNDYNDGARALKNYLRYAEACSAGNADAARRVLWEVNAAETAKPGEATNHVVADQLAAKLRERGYEVAANIGQSSFRVDLAVRRKNEPRFALGLLIDTEAYYRNDDLVERDLLRPRLLRDFGWEVIQVFTKDWYLNADAVVKYIEVRLGSGE